MSEVELVATTLEPAMLLLEELREWMSTSTGVERMSAETALATHRIVWIVSVVEPFSQFRV